MSQLHTIGGTTYIVTHQKLKEVFPYDESRANPLLWFGFDLETRDVVATGTRTQRECLEILEGSGVKRRVKKETK